jgi:hypothetical protein
MANYVASSANAGNAAYVLQTPISAERTHNFVSLTSQIVGNIFLHD